MGQNILDYLKSKEENSSGRHIVDGIKKAALTGLAAATILTNVTGCNTNDGNIINTTTTSKKTTTVASTTTTLPTSVSTNTTTSSGTTTLTASATTANTTGSTTRTTSHTIKNQTTSTTVQPTLTYPTTTPLYPLEGLPTNIYGIYYGSKPKEGTITMANITADDVIQLYDWMALDISEDVDWQRYYRIYFHSIIPPQKVVSIDGESYTANMPFYSMTNGLLVNHAASGWPGINIENAYLTQFNIQVNEGRIVSFACLFDGQDFDDVMKGLGVGKMELSLNFASELNKYNLNKELYEGKYGYNAIPIEREMIKDMDKQTLYSLYVAGLTAQGVLSSWDFCEQEDLQVEPER